MEHQVSVNVMLSTEDDAPANVGTFDGIAHRESAEPEAPTNSRSSEDGRRTATAGRQRLFNCWIGLILGNLWEGILLLAIYLCIRWFPSLRGNAVILLASALAVFMKECLFLYGRHLERFTLWMMLAYRKYAKVPGSRIDGLLSQFAGYYSQVLLPLLPVYIIYMPLFILTSLAVGRTYTRAKSCAFWQRLGTLVSELFFQPLCWFAKVKITGPEPIAMFHWFGQQWPSEKRSNVGSQEDGSRGTDPFSRPPYEVLFEFLEWSDDRHVCFNTINTFFLFVFKVARALLPVAWLALGIAVFGLAVLCIPFGVLFMIVFLITGNHLTIFIVVCFEIVTTVLDADLGNGHTEMIVISCYVIPIISYAECVFFEKLIHEGLSAMKAKLGSEHELSKLAELYDAIPLDGVQTAMKISDTATGKDGLSSSREPAFLVMSVHGGTRNSFRCSIVEEGNEHLFMNGMLTRRKHDTKLIGSMWKGIDDAVDATPPRHLP